MHSGTIILKLSNILGSFDIRKLTQLESASLDGMVTIEELGQALNHKKKNKCPGIDGFPSEFF